MKFRTRLIVPNLAHMFVECYKVTNGTRKHQYNWTRGPERLDLSIYFFSGAMDPSIGSSWASGAPIILMSLPPTNVDHLHIMFPACIFEFAPGGW